MLKDIESIRSKQKFVVIPSTQTFQEFVFDAEQEQYEICLNFCLIFPFLGIDEADFYLCRYNYNLALAIENYQFDIC